MQFCAKKYIIRDFIDVFYNLHNAKTIIRTKLYFFNHFAATLSNFYDFLATQLKLACHESPITQSVSPTIPNLNINYYFKIFFRKKKKKKTNRRKVTEGCQKGGVERWSAKLDRQRQVQKGTCRKRTHNLSKHPRVRAAACGYNRIRAYRQAQV